MIGVSQRNWFASDERIRTPLLGSAAKQSDRRANLRFSEWMLIAILALAYFLTISKPVFGMQLHLTPLNHVPFVLMIPILVFHMTGVLFNRTQLPWSKILGVSWPLLLLSIYALLGSSYAKWSLHIDDSYLTFGLYLMMLPIYISVTADGARLERWQSVLISLWVTTSIIAHLGEVARFGSDEILHEIEYFVISGFFVLYYHARNVAIKALAIILMLTSAIVNRKLTGFLIGGFGLMHIAFIGGWRILPRTWRGLYGISALVSSLALISFTVALYYYFRDGLPTGNVDVRLKQYEAAYYQFIASPIWGNAYTKGSGELFREGFRLLNIPTHSDVVDILKHGGLIGFSLFALGYWKIFSLFNKVISLTRKDHRINAYFTGMRFFQVTALVTFSFNPLMLKGPFLITIWATLGLACGMALVICERYKRPSI